MNFAPGVSRLVTNIRWNRALRCFEMRCNDCRRRRDGAYWWPITTQFWDLRTLQRCRACEVGRTRLAQRAYDAARQRPHRRAARA